MGPRAQWGGAGPRLLAQGVAVEAWTCEPIAKKNALRLEVCLISATFCAECLEAGGEPEAPRLTGAVFDIVNPPHVTLRAQSLVRRLTMQTVYIAKVYAAHDFNNLVKQRVFASRVVAYRWVTNEANTLAQEAFAHDGWEDYDFRTAVIAEDFDESECML